MAPLWRSRMGATWPASAAWLPCLKVPSRSTNSKRKCKNFRLLLLRDLIKQSLNIGQGGTGEGGKICQCIRAARFEQPSHRLSCNTRRPALDRGTFRGGLAVSAGDISRHTHPPPPSSSFVAAPR